MTSAAPKPITATREEIFERAHHAGGEIRVHGGGQAYTIRHRGEDGSVVRRETFRRVAWGLYRLETQA